MVIREKSLVREIKEAFKGGGYTVICRPGETTVIMCSNWAVEINDENLPREVLSLLALHMGYLPKKGEAYRIMKADKEPTVQKMLFETAISPVRTLEIQVAEAQDTIPVKVKKTLLTFDGCSVWQKTGNNGIVLIDPEYESILRKKDDVIMAGDAIYKEGEVSKVFVMRVNDAAHENQLNHLGQIPWVAK